MLIAKEVIQRHKSVGVGFVHDDDFPGVELVSLDDTENRSGSVFVWLTKQDFSC